MKRLLIAFQFLTIIPVKASISINENDIAKSSSFFVIVGLIQGILLIATDYIATMVFPSDIVTLIILLVLILSNGGFHLDGLADTFDAIGARGDKEKKLSIMKDSTIGPIGVIAVVFTLLLKFLALNSLSHISVTTFHLSLFLMPILPKWAMVISMFHGRPARDDGLGRIFIKRTGIKETAISTLILFLLLISPYVFLSRYMSDIQYAFYAVLLTTMYLSCRLWVNFFNKIFGGLTGDTLGAISEITELIFLLTVIAWLRLSI